MGRGKKNPLSYCGADCLLIGREKEKRKRFEDKRWDEQKEKGENSAGAQLGVMKLLVTTSSYSVPPPSQDFFGVPL